jgi:hypothetical protein
MKITKILFGALYFGPISLHEILPDMDKQDSISELSSSASELMEYIFEKRGQNEREELQSVAQSFVLLALQK